LLQEDNLLPLAEEDKQFGEELSNCAAYLFSLAEIEEDLPERAPYLRLN